MGRTRGSCTNLVMCKKRTGAHAPRSVALDLEPTIIFSIITQSKPSAHQTPAQTAV